MSIYISARPCCLHPTRGSDLGRKASITKSDSTDKEALVTHGYPQRSTALGLDLGRGHLSGVAVATLPKDLGPPCSPQQNGGDPSC